MKNKFRPTYIALNVLMLWFALILQFYISTNEFMAKGRSMAGALVQIISYFTIETNILIVVALTILLIKPASAWGRFFSRAYTLTAITVYIVIVGLIYALVLKGLQELNGLFKLTDFLLHTLSPISFVIFWIFFAPHDKIKWSNIIYWTTFPLFYLAYSLIRGAISGYYPYPFLDVTQFGYGQVAINSVYVLIAFLVISAIFIGGSRLLWKANT
jgi:hypothetical protein